MTILSNEEIEHENSRMFLEDESLVSLLSFPKFLKGSVLKDMIISDPLPGEEIDIHILKNRNIKILSDEAEVRYGITISKTTLKYLPTEATYYSTKIREENVATELSFAEPILILHTSKDQEWSYIQSYYYRGWLKCSDISILDEPLFLKFIQPERFIIITTNIATFETFTLDMGVKLPLLANHPDFYEVLIPTNYEPKIEQIPSSIAHMGYLPYTDDNILEQAYKYLNTPYYWGGTDNGLDCSLLIVNIFKTFGFLFPRDTKNQEKVVGIQNINLRGKTEEEKKEILRKVETPFILFKPGHVLLAVKEDTVLHAYGDAGKVFMSKIENSHGTNLYPLLTSISVLYKNKKD